MDGKNIIKEAKEWFQTRSTPIKGILVHVAIYSLALILAYSAYREIAKGYAHIVSHFIPPLIRVPDLSHTLSKSIKETFPWAILIFTCLYLAVTRLNSKESRLRLNESIKIVAMAIVLLNGIFLSRPEGVLVVLNLSLAFFVLFLFALQGMQRVVHLTLHGERAKGAAIAQEIGYRLERYLPYIEPLIALLERVENNRWLVTLTRSSVAVFIFYASVAVMAYLPTMNDILRSDHWFFLTLARSPETTWRDVVSFEMFGHFHFQPLRWLMFYAIDKLFNNNMLLYHVLSVTVHLINGLVIFLILRTILETGMFTFLMGLLFIVCTSHFDAVTWSLMFDWQVGTLFYLLALLLLVRYIWLKSSITNVYLAILLSAIPTMLEEGFVLGPMFILISFLLAHRCSEGGAKQDTLVPSYSILCLVFAFYLLYLYGALVLNPLVGVAKKGPFDILTWENGFRGFYTTLTFVVNMNILNNIGLFPPEVEIHNLVYLYPPLFGYGGALFKSMILLSLFVTLFWYSRRLKNWYFTLPLVLTGLFYLWIISTGRIRTGGFEYILTRSHYAYFTNALFLTAVALTVWPPDERVKRFFLVSGLLVLITLNFKNTLLSNEKVADAMQTMDAHYYRVERFLKTNPGATLFIDFIPHNKNDYFAMCTDKALDICFGSRITKFVKRATHTYDSEAFIPNNKYDPATPNTPSLLEDFTIEWLSCLSPEYLRREVVVIGSDRMYPKISIVPGGFVSVQMENCNTRGLDTYNVHYPGTLFRSPVGQDWAWIVIEKHGKELCFILNGTLYEKFPLNDNHLGWQKDGVELLGNYHKGMAESVQIGRLYVKIGESKYRCGNKRVGDTFEVPDSRYHQ